MIINKKYTFPRHIPVKLMQSETLTKYWSIFYGFCMVIGRNGVLYSGIWPRHRVSNQNKGISMTSLQILVPYKHVTAYQIESKNISINRIDKISYQWHHYSGYNVWLPSLNLCWIPISGFAWSLNGRYINVRRCRGLSIVSQQLKGPYNYLWRERNFFQVPNFNLVAIWPKLFKGT